jgi:hypothetical protein
MRESCLSIPLDAVAVDGAAHQEIGARLAAEGKTGHRSCGPPGGHAPRCGRAWPQRRPRRRTPATSGHRFKINPLGAGQFLFAKHDRIYGDGVDGAHPCIECAMMVVVETIHQRSAVHPITVFPVVNHDPARYWGLTPPSDFRSPVQSHSTSGCGPSAFEAPARLAIPSAGFARDGPS